MLFCNKYQQTNRIMIGMVQSIYCLRGVATDPATSPSFQQVGPSYLLYVAFDFELHNINRQ